MLAIKASELKDFELARQRKAKLILIEKPLKLDLQAIKRLSEHSELVIPFEKLLFADQTELANWLHFASFLKKLCKKAKRKFTIKSLADNPLAKRNEKQLQALVEVL